MALFSFRTKNKHIGFALSVILFAVVVKYPSVAPSQVAVNSANIEPSLLVSVSRTLWDSVARIPLSREMRESSSTKNAEQSSFRTSCGMDREMVSLFLQSYNAGPYAVTRFNGSVPYRETRAYVPRVLSFYKQDLRDTPYDALIVESAQRHGLDPQLVRAIMKAESNFRNRTTSRAGARGLMQVMPVTWNAVRKKTGINWNYSSNVFDPAKNIEVACAYLSWVRYEHLPRNFAAFQDGPSRAPFRDGTLIARNSKDSKTATGRNPQARSIADARGKKSESAKARQAKNTEKTQMVPGSLIRIAEDNSKKRSDREAIQFSWAR